MTDAELAALQARLRDVEVRSAATIARYEAIKARQDESPPVDIPALVAAYEAALEIVRAVAAGDAYHDSTGGMLVVAAPDALLAKARALLGDEAARDG